MESSGSAGGSGSGIAKTAWTTTVFIGLTRSDNTRGRKPRGVCGEG